MKELPLYLEANGEKRLVGTAVPELDADGHLRGFNARITDETLEGFGRPLKQNPLVRMEEFSIGDFGEEGA
jgi:hypothetical protein